MKAKQFLFNSGSMIDYEELRAKFKETVQNLQKLSNEEMINVDDVYINNEGEVILFKLYKCCFLEGFVVLVISGIK